MKLFGGSFSSRAARSASRVSWATRGQGRWSLSGDGFERLLARLAPDSDAAGERFQAVHSRLTVYFTHERVFDPEYWADVTLDRAAKRLAEEVPVGDIYAFIHGIARFVAQEARREEVRNREVLRSQPLPSEPEPDAGMACLEHCMSGMAEADRSLIQRYYSGSGRTLIDERKRLALELGISIELLRTRALRIRKELESCVRLCQEREDPMS